MEHVVANTAAEAVHVASRAMHHAHHMMRVSTNQCVSLLRRDRARARESAIVEEARVCIRRISFPMALLPFSAFKQGGRLQRHEEPWEPPQRGSKLQMVGEARRCGAADVVFDGHEWVIDPEGRAPERSAWSMTVL